MWTMGYIVRAVMTLMLILAHAVTQTMTNGEMAERLNAAVLKTADGDELSLGSNPSLSSTVKG